MAALLAHAFKTHLTPSVAIAATAQSTDASLDVATQPRKE